MILEKKFLVMKMNVDRQQKSYMVHLKENGIPEFVPKDVFGKMKMCTGIKTRVAEEEYSAKQSVKEMVSQVLICIVTYIIGIISKVHFKRAIKMFDCLLHNRLIRRRWDVGLMGWVVIVFEDMWQRGNAKVSYMYKSKT